MIELLLNYLFKGPLLLSWAISLGITAILLSPTLLILFHPKCSKLRLKFTTAGIVFGALAIPLSFWLYIHFFVGPLRGLIFGLPGVIMLGVHLSAFRNAGIASHEIVQDPHHGFSAGLASTPYQEVLFLMGSYALLGTLVDWFLARKSARIKPPAGSADSS